MLFSEGLILPQMQEDCTASTKLSYVPQFASGFPVDKNLGVFFSLGINLVRSNVLGVLPRHLKNPMRPLLFETGSPSRCEECSEYNHHRLPFVQN